jgi:hypothetical protein
MNSISFCITTSKNEKYYTFGLLKSLEKQAEKGVLKNTAKYYSPENVSKQLNKIGYNYTKDIDKLAEDETKLAKDILLKERKLRTQSYGIVTILAFL